MPKPTVSDFLLDRLEAWGVRIIYGYAGDGINPILGALERAGDRFRFVQTAHEEQAGELSARLPDGAIVSGDSGSAAVWLARDLRLRRGMLASLSGTLATMGSGLTYALAGKTVHPDRPAIALVGDGAMQMAGLNSLITVAKYWREWADPRLIALVLNNRDLSYVTWEQRAMEGEPKFSASQDLLDVPYARVAELLGLRGIRVERPEQVGPAWDEALAADRPVVLDVLVDADVPTLPPRLKEEQAKKLAQALAAGDPNRAGVERQLAREGVGPH
jgi:pyruvate dehydrogenase (quinone)